MSLIARFMGANMKPIWGRQDPGGPHVDPMNFAIWGVLLPIDPIPLLLVTVNISSCPRVEICPTNIRPNWLDMKKLLSHVDVIKWKHFPRYWPFGRGIPRSPVNSPHKGQWRGGLEFSLICAWTNGWVKHNRDAVDLRRHCAHYDVTVVWPASRQPLVSV